MDWLCFAPMEDGKTGMRSDASDIRMKCKEKETPSARSKAASALVVQFWIDREWKLHSLLMLLNCSASMVHGLKKQSLCRRYYRMWVEGTLPTLRTATRAVGGIVVVSMPNE
jgi:hypothetical protein